MEINVVQKVMKVNDELAAAVRQELTEAGVVALNIMSSPGSGKTTLIEKTLAAIKDSVRVAVLEGDPETSLDAERIAKFDVPVTQIETAGGCHLEANLVKRALANFDLPNLDLLIIENVGNLVCPVGFDLGENAQVGMVSTTEGHDKPAKYPNLFRKADVIILNKIDLLPYINFDFEQFRNYVHDLNPETPLIDMSCTTGEGFEAWLLWIKEKMALESAQPVA
ncbi:MAG: hydrogenase nickel incorporation protein HypB [Candidatus Hydrogenedentes bacterium]|nr:hydrogenase nickel incorporation protein HypB [Candidatus Hydrogenedentota bacterium]